MKDFHALVRHILNGWLVVYALLLAPGLLRGLFFYVIADFTLSDKHYLDIMNTVEIASLWLVPTAFLVLAYVLSKPSRSSYSGG